MSEADRQSRSAALAGRNCRQVPQGPNALKVNVWPTGPGTRLNNIEQGTRIASCHVKYLSELGALHWQAGRFQRVPQILHGLTGLQGPANTLSVPSFMGSLSVASEQSPSPNPCIAGMPIPLTKQELHSCCCQVQMHTLQASLHQFPNRAACFTWHTYPACQAGRQMVAGAPPQAACNTSESNVGHPPGPPKRPVVTIYGLASQSMLTHASPSSTICFFKQERMLTMPAHLSPHAGTPHSGSGPRDAGPSASQVLQSHLTQSCLRRGRGGWCQQAAVVPHCSQHAQPLAARHARCFTRHHDAGRPAGECGV